MLKICGITDGYFASRATAAGVDYLGFIFASGSPRSVTPERAAEIIAAVRRDAAPRMVGVFTLRPVADVLRVADEVGFDVVQLHGRFTPWSVTLNPSAVICFIRSAMYAASLRRLSSAFFPPKVMSSVRFSSPVS